MLEFLRNTTSRRIFLVLAALAGVIAYGGAVYLDSSRQKIDLFDGAMAGLIQLLYGGAGAIFGAGLVLLLFRLFRKQETRMEQVECLDPAQTRLQHDQAVKSTDFWFHNGHIARWVRTTALDELTNRARQGSVKDIKVLVIDPRDPQMVTAYATYRSRIGYREDHFTTADDTLQEILATVIALQICNDGNRGVVAELYFRDVLSYSRVDISASRAFRTLVDPRVPSAVYHNQTDDVRTSFYYALKEDFIHQIQKADRYDFPIHQGMERGKLTVPQIDRYLAANNLLTGATHSYYRQIINRVESKFNGIRPHR